jgi:hypothetical protein
MVTKDNYSSKKYVQTIAPVNLTGNGATITGTVVDTQGYESATAIINVGISGDALAANLNHVFTLQHGDASDGTGMADCTADYTINGSSTVTLDAMTEDVAVYKIGYKGTKRYLRVVDVITGNAATGMPGSATIVLANARRVPIS